MALLVVLVALFLDVVNRYEPIGIDFHTYLAAALVGVQHGWSAIYDQDLVAAAQKQLVPEQIAQPFLSPPTDAWLTVPLTPLPYWVAYWVWAVTNLVAFAAALVWASRSRGFERWLYAAAALAPWWVIHAVNLGQVAPLVATGAVVATRFARERNDVAAGIALSLLYLKPNTALLVPLALLVAGRYRIFAAWAAAGCVIAIVAILSMGVNGISDYLGQLTGELPTGANNLTVEGAFGITGGAATALRVVIAAVTLVTAYRLRSSPCLVIATGALGSLLVVPYLHGSDLCLFSAAAWMVWEEKAWWGWRMPIAAGWLISVPYINSTSLAIRLNRWTLFEVALLVALAVVAWWPAWRRVTVPASA
ncbi:MAG TPA: glycosyltransferase family 87 protein [Candidatus Dormibacteraeota bacterium]